MNSIDKAKKSQNHEPIPMHSSECAIVENGHNWSKKEVKHHLNHLLDYQSHLEKNSYEAWACDRRIAFLSEKIEKNRMNRRKIENADRLPAHLFRVYDILLKICSQLALSDIHRLYRASKDLYRDIKEAEWAILTQLSQRTVVRRLGITDNFFKLDLPGVLSEYAVDGRWMKFHRVNFSRPYRASQYLSGIIYSRFISRGWFVNAPMDDRLVNLCKCNRFYGVLRGKKMESQQFTHLFLQSPPPQHSFRLNFISLLTDLVSLTLVDMGLTTIPSKVLLPLKQLITLNLSYNRLTFLYLPTTQLLNLNISYNAIQTLDLRALKELVSLNVVHNSLKQLSLASSALTFLKMSKNPLERLECNGLSALSMSQYIQFQHSYAIRLENMPVPFFSLSQFNGIWNSVEIVNCTMLDYADLERSQIIFNRWLQLGDHYLSNTYSAPPIFFSNSEIEHLSIKGSAESIQFGDIAKVRTLEFSLCEMKELILPSTPHLSKLKLTNCHFQSIIFEYAPNLDELIVLGEVPKLLTFFTDKATGDKHYLEYNGNEFQHKKSN